MLTIQDYAAVNSLDEAFELLEKRRINTLLGGGAFLRLGSKRIGTAIDLSKLALDYVNEMDNVIEIGAMTTLRQIETSSALLNNFTGVLPRAASAIGGVQLRNIATVGGTVYSRYGFSDFLTALMVLNADVLLYKKGKIPLEQFMKEGSPRDILIKVIVPKTGLKASFLSVRNSKNDLAVLNAAVSRQDSRWRIAVGARPQRAALAVNASLYLSESLRLPESVERAAILACKELVFGTNLRAGAEYRKNICQVLVKRAITEVLQ